MKNKNKNQNPLVSVIMPVYNAGNFLMEAIESILNQTYQNFEFIIVDDASTDNSFNVINYYAKIDKRIKPLRNKKNLGIAKTINKALSHVKGQFIARMDADDIAMPNRLEKQVEFLINNPEIGVLGSQMFEINEKNIITNVRKVPLTNKNIKKNLFITQTIQNPTLMVNKKNIPEGILTYDPKFSPVDDLDVFFKLARYTKFANLPNYLIFYRKHKSNSSLKNIRKTFFLTIKARINAVLKYGYRPNFISIIINILQTFAIFTLPQNLIYKLFKFFKSSNIEYKNIKVNDFLINKKFKKVDISLVIPVYKGEKFIEKNIIFLNNFLKKQKIKYEIITVVDGKVDNSYKILLKMAFKNPNLKVYGYDINHGKGFAVRYGINKAKYSYVGFIDAGFDIHYSSLETIINSIKNYHLYKVFIADKNHPMSLTENIPFLRKIFSFIFNQITSIMLKTEKIDTQVGLKIFEKKVIQEILKNLPLELNGFSFDIEIIKEVMKRNYKICRVPVTIIKEKQTTVTFKHVLEMFFDLFKLYNHYIFQSNIKMNQYSLENNFNYRLKPIMNYKPIINMFF
jgi:glycosyltransferase involved in cell wall biosynthesis